MILFYESSEFFKLVEKESTLKIYCVKHTREIKSEYKITNKGFKLKITINESNKHKRQTIST
jgi:hypothetical protein